MFDDLWEDLVKSKEDSERFFKVDKKPYQKTVFNGMSNELH